MTKDKEDVIRFGQNVHTTQAFSKKETLKRPVSSLEGSITKLLTGCITGWQLSAAELAVRVHAIVRSSGPVNYIPEICPDCRDIQTRRSSDGRSFC
jgi:hypothetical protein